MSAPVLELVDLTAGYGDNPIVRGFSARLYAGTITTLIGGNGAGKSTLLRAIYGANRWFSGQIVFAGRGNVFGAASASCRKAAAISRR